MKVEIKKKRKLSWWWFLLAPLLVLVMLFIQAFGPNPEIELGKETTVITEPLREDGFPNYPQYVIDRQKQGVTPENNAAIPITRALWPGELTPENYAAVLENLQMPLPDEADALVSPYEISEDLKAWILREAPDADEEALDQDFLWGIIERAMYSPWEPGELPTIETWAEHNETPMNWLIEGAALPKYYYPPPNIDTMDGDLMIAWLLPDVQAIRQAGRALCVRSMWHLSHDRHEECWQDLLACYQLARHMNQGHTIVHNLVGAAIESMAGRNIHQLMHDEKISDELLQKIQRDLASLTPRRTMAEFIDEGERLAALDVAIRIANGQVNPNDLGIEDMGMMQVAATLRMDPNIVLKEINGWYDRQVAVAKLPFLERLDEIEKLDNDFQQLNPGGNPGRLARSIISTTSRSEVAADVFVMLMLPATQAAVNAEDRIIAFDDLNKASLALARFRKKNGMYPDKLDELVPNFANEIPIDLYTSEPLVYRKKPDGFLLYSVFQDGFDNGGTGINADTVEGEYVSEEANVDMAACDLVVRIPKPRFQMPAIPIATEAFEDETDEEPDPEEEDTHELEQEAVSADSAS